MAEPEDIMPELPLRPASERSQGAGTNCEAPPELHLNLVDSLPISIMVFNAQGRVVSVNRWHVEIFNHNKLPVSFFLGQTMHELPGLRSAGVADALAVAFQGKRVFMDEVHVPRFASGRSGYQRIRCFPLFENNDPQAAISGVVLIREDITAQVLSKRRLQEAEAKYRSLFETAPVGIFMTTMEGRFLEVNRAMAAMMGYDSPREVIEHITDIAKECYVRPEERISLLQEIQRRGGAILGVEREFKRRDGTVFTATLHARCIADEQGLPLRLEGLLTDTTARRQAEEALRQAKREAEKANTAKSAFLASISHDLRTPLHHILGMADLAAAEATSPNQREYLHLQQAAGGHLLALVDDLLDLSVIESGKLELTIAPLSLKALMEDVRNLFQMQAQAKSLEFSVFLEQNLADIRLGDSFRLRQVLVNLVGNAIKYTVKGSVQLYLGADPGTPGRLTFRVQDTGPGIPKRKQREIFAPYVRLQPSARTGGTGLGLAIARRLVQLMGGEILLHSAVGKGSRFELLLPLPVAQAPAAPIVASAPGVSEQASSRRPPLPGTPSTPLPEHLPARVLVVEDEPVSRLYSRTVMEKAGLRADTVADGAEALQRLTAYHYDAVMLDMHLQDMDGLAVLRSLRNAGNSWATPSDVPVLVVTALAMRGDRKRILAAGANGYLAKPASGAQLLEALARLSGAAPSS
ncbi:ATP-binding protein [Megalodesulfovibrio paquesii]